MPKRAKSKGAADTGMQFLQELDGREVQSLAKARGTIRFDLADNGQTKHVRVELDRGRISVSRGAAAADCVVRMDAKLFGDLAAGKANPLAALLRGVLTFNGDPELLVLFRRALAERRSS
jgi:putative sterol carrier protein